MVKQTLDRIDRKIIHELMRDATLPIAELADRVNLSQTPCWKRVRKLETAGVITGRVAVVDPNSIGLGLSVFVEIEATEHTAEWRGALTRVVKDFPEIIEAHRMAGDVDYLLKVAVPDMAAFDAFYVKLTETLPCRNVTSKFSMERIKATTVWPIDITTP
ncbi:Lrp/AsnC family transcriptional regulator [Ketogulonicigenium vulgare]|uniref:Transcriptional regulator AsnC-family YbaO n=1 Tax=Ketogulonicigenium vulgare (strain WSH-001) TaxID=759362 RepID=F9Y6S6_KETVW|nr:Lrp/AsnC family transcriptional regulator [Ketogulonicigenium vulgare]ADO42756.1 AsnC family transcriptional regulator [Ketogulonicigenium vulgare Y25]AEM40943.1 transcriptional regulator AsnC-family YbaO [Ketogulonicigenium vulgare WSH-001]ALJ81096.1 transcriptional regulator [Ketogulonicigenium vulgare]ANW35043.1 transcriptional regulator [Ketogulonicigenium vulgare]AOZ54668.1 AsnC family transcriptional regulator [Ketogulonicigenium vulgare]